MLKEPQYIIEFHCPAPIVRIFALLLSVSVALIVISRIYWPNDGLLIFGVVFATVNLCIILLYCATIK